MSLLLTMFPVYLFGNLHCIGMCGPLVMMIGHHQYRYFYFLGRLLSFSLVGMLAGEAGYVLHTVLQAYHISAAACFLFGGIILLIGIMNLLGASYPGERTVARILAPLNRRVSTLLLRDQPWPAFLFGFFTVTLPCGQTLIVFSACALAGDPLVGLINGFAFALITSPSLFLAMHAHSLLQKMRLHYNTIMGILAIIVGTLALLRGFAEVGAIPHWVLNPNSPSYYHVVVY